MSDSEKKKTSLLDSSFPVLVPENASLRANDEDFSRYINSCFTEVRLAIKYSQPVGPSPELKRRMSTDIADSDVNQRTKRKNHPDRRDATGASEKLAKMDLESRKDDDDDSFTMVSGPVSSSFVDVDVKMADVEVESDTKKPAKEAAPEPVALTHPFMDAMTAAATSVDGLPGAKTENKMLTENAGVAWRSTESPLLDLFTELERVVSGAKLRELLENAWRESPIDTVKLIFNARSIHLGKAEKDSFYRCMGWMRMNHPRTVIANLEMLTKPVIDKSPLKEKAGPSDEKSEKTLIEGEVVNGLAHGYWKDLLAILVLEVNGSLVFDLKPDDILHTPNKQLKKNKPDIVRLPRNARRGTKRPMRDRSAPTPKKRTLEETETFNEEQRIAAKDKKHAAEKSRHDRFIYKFSKDGFYQALHLTIARLFAAQLKSDLALLASKKKSDLNKISLAAKWAPSPEGFHDKHTFIASSIAELLYDSPDPDVSREDYLKQARLHYREKYLSPLRKALAVVERDVSAETFDKIDYKRIPSIAMNTYKDLFAKKDLDHYEAYIDAVTQGTSRISGATLNPGQLTRQAMQAAPQRHGTADTSKPTSAKALIEAKQSAIAAKTLDAQWDSLVKRIKDAGALTESIGVCDVSGSMSSPTFADKTCPLHSSIGLSILLSEVTAPPFGGTMISFSEKPKIHTLPGHAKFTEKVAAAQRVDMGFSTNFIGVFRDCILPVALKAKLPPEKMVKQVFVFSDMQFDQAQSSSSYSVSPLWESIGTLKPKKHETWDTHYEVVEKLFNKHGYEVPRLIFWNLAGGRAGFTGYGDPTVPKPVKANTPNTALVSGYSQGMLKVFLEGGEFDALEEEEEEVKGPDGKVEKKKGKTAADPLAVMRKAIAHPSYDGLVVVD